MGYYVKKPILVHAARFVNGEFPMIESWLREKWIENKWCYKLDDYTGEIVGFIVDTLEGRMTAGEGDYIVMGIKGELYPCRGDIFEETYERLEDLENELFNYAVANAFSSHSG